MCACVCVCVRERRLSTPKRRYGRGSHRSTWTGRCVCRNVCVEAEYAEEEVRDGLPHISLGREVCVCVPVCVCVYV